MIYQGLDDEEFEHIEQVKQKEYDATIKRLQEEGEQIKVFRNAQAVRTAEAEKGSTIKVGGRLGKARLGTKKKTSQLQMLSGMIKRKRKSGDDASGAAVTDGSAGAAGAAATSGMSASKKAKSTTRATLADVVRNESSSDDSSDGVGGGLVGYNSDDSDWFLQHVQFYLHLLLYVLLEIVFRT